MKIVGAVLAGFVLWSVLWTVGNMVLQKLYNLPPIAIQSITSAHTAMLL